MTKKVMQAPFKYKRFTTDAINTYTGANGEPILDLRTGSPVLRICDGVTQGCHLVGASGVAGVAVPDIIAPVDGTTGVTISPMITASAFFGVKEDGSADSHQASTFNFYADVDKTTLLHTSGRLTSGELTTYDTQGIYNFTSYSAVYLEVEYEGASGNRSTSPLIVFTTLMTTPETQLAKLIASDGSPDDNFGNSVALSDDGLTAIIGAHSNDDDGIDSGSAYIFKNEAGIWNVMTKLTADDGLTQDHFGSSVALSGDGLTAIVGAYRDDNADPNSNVGSAYIFEYLSGTWTQVSKQMASDGALGDYFGWSVALSNDGLTALVSAYRADNTGEDLGSVYVLEKLSGVWTETEKLTASDASGDDLFGSSVALSNDGLTALIGAVGDAESGALSGAAYVFNKVSGNWNEIIKLKASDGSSLDYLGAHVALSGDGCTALLGASGDDDPSTSSGSAYIYKKISDTWSEVAKLTVSDIGSSAYFGCSVALSSNGLTALVGAYNTNVLATESGAIYTFKEVSGIWSQIDKIIPNDSARKDHFGYSVSLSADGSTALVGSYDDDDKGYQSGSAYIFG